MIKFSIKMIFLLKSFCYFAILNLFVGTSSTDLKGFNSANSSHEDRLRHDLLPNYVRSIIPIAHPETIDVQLRLRLNHFEIEELSGSAILYGLMQSQWHDGNLKWKKEDYGNIDTLHLTSDDIWTPDISLYNTANMNMREFKMKGYCKVESNGLVTWSPQIRFESFCRLDLTNWPYDKQICNFILGLWVHHGYQINTTLIDNKPFIDEFVENHEWKIIDSHQFREEKFYACCAEPYPTFTFSFDIERRSPMLKVVLLTPAFCVTLMCLACFWLPPKRGEKIIIIGVNIIILTIIMFYFAKRIPAFSLKIPLVVIYYSVLYVLVTFAMIISVGILAISKSLKNCGKLPIGLKRIFQSNFGHILGVAEMGNLIKDQTELKDHFEDVKCGDNHFLIKEDNYEDDWIMFATGINRIFFYCYSLVFAIMAGICFL